jgi:cytoskeleton protein RodZ
MSATPPSEFRTGIGARLKAGRERLGLTLLQVAEKLHVDASVVEKLEAERFGEFDAPVYVKGHIKRYSELVSENTQELLDAYSAAIKPVLPDLTQLPKVSQHATDPRKLVLPSLVVLIAFALVGTVWWVLQNVGKLNPPVTPQAVQTTDEAPTAVPNDAPGASDVLPSAATAPTPSSPTASRDAGSNAPNASTVRAIEEAPSSAAQSAPGGQTSAPAQSSALNSGTAQPQSSATARRGTGTRAGTTAGAASSAQITKTTKLAAATTPAATAPPEPQQRLKSIDLTLKFAADSWAEVYDANGQRLFYDIGSANSSHAVTGTPPLRVVLGNAPGVTVNINGRAAKVPASAVQNDSAQFTINRSGRIVRARPTQAASPEEAASAASKPNGEH